MPRVKFQEAAEEALIEHGAIRRRSYQRREMIGCIACRWAKSEAQGKSPRTYGFEIMRCTAMSAGNLYPLLRQLKEAGAVVAETDLGSSVGPAQRVYYSPADSDVGKAFRANLHIPDDCSLEEHKLEVQRTQGT